MKSRLIELCPIHKCLPVISKYIFVPASKVTTYTGEVVEVPETAEFVCYCPKCRANKSYFECNSKFGCGYTSKSSMSAAVSNWNKACARYARRAIKAALIGKNL